MEREAREQRAREMLRALSARLLSGAVVSAVLAIATMPPALLAAGPGTRSCADALAMARALPDYSVDPRVGRWDRVLIDAVHAEFASCRRDAGEPADAGNAVRGLIQCDLALAHYFEMAAKNDVSARPAAGRTEFFHRDKVEGMRALDDAHRLIEFAERGTSTLAGSLQAIDRDDDAYRKQLAALKTLTFDGASKERAATAAEWNVSRTPPPAMCAVPDADAAIVGVPAKPVYPEVAREQGAVGRVLVRVELNANGSVTRVSIFKSSGNISLDFSAVAAARATRYAAQRISCVPLAGSYLFEADFGGS